MMSLWLSGRIESSKRIRDVSHYSDISPAVDFEKILLYNGKEDQSHIKHNAMIARVLQKYMPYFKTFGNGPERHLA